jgi:hypothetical protein
MKQKQNTVYAFNKEQEKNIWIKNLYIWIKNLKEYQSLHIWVQFWPKTKV